MHKHIFSYFDPHRALRRYRGNLPHWRQDNALYFVTIRLAESIPGKILAAWHDARRVWMEAHGILGYPKSVDWQKCFYRLPEDERRIFYRMTARQFFTELDACHGECWLRTDTVREILVESIRHFDGYRWHLGDFVVMPNHVHLLVVMKEGYELEEVLYSIKRFSARRINGVLNRSGQFWQKEYYDHIVRDHAELCRIREYIARNPAKAGLKVGEYGLYSARWLDDIVQPNLP